MNDSNQTEITVVDEAAVETRETLKAVVIAVLNLEISRGQIDADSNLFSLGIDSMTVVSLVIAIEEEFGVQIPEDMLAASVFERFENLFVLIRSQQQLL
jgi:acyl carrier protein